MGTKRSLIIYDSDEEDTQLPIKQRSNDNSTTQVDGSQSPESCYMQDGQDWEKNDVIFQNNRIQEDDIKILQDAKVESNKIKYASSTTQTDFEEEKTAATSITIRFLEDDTRILHNIKVENYEIEYANSTTQTDSEEGKNTDVSIETQNECIYNERDIRDANTEFGLFVARELSNVPFNKRRNIMCEIIRIFEYKSV